MCTEFALKFSKDNNIVEEKINGKKTWANLKHENGKHRGGHGYITSQETKNKQSKVAIGRKHTEETRKKISDNHSKHNLDKLLSEETRKKMSISAKGKKLSKETKHKISMSSRNKIISDAAKSKISKSLLNHEVSKETRKRISEGNKGKRHRREFCKYCNKSYGLGIFKRHHLNKCN